MNKNKISVLINTPNINFNGGVANHFLGLKDKFSARIYYNYIGGNSDSYFFFIYQIYDYISFIFKIFYFNPQIIHLNPSLDKKSVIRDSIYLVISKIFRKKILVFFHGWDNDFEKMIKNKYKNIFVKIINYSDGVCVLCSDFKQTFYNWGVTTPIFLESTKVDDNLIQNFNIKEKIYNNEILFLARIEKNKGIYIAIDAIKKLDAKLFIAGTGGELENCKKYVKENRISNIFFLGYVSGRDKIEILKNTSIYILPTTHGEGMPTSVLEAMAFGLTIITRPVGGLKDFFVTDKMGLLTDSLNHLTYREYIKKMIISKNKMIDIGLYNHKYCAQNFLASKVASNLESIYKKVYNS